jgi:signal transduction histidine kinase
MSVAHRLSIAFGSLICIIALGGAIATWEFSTVLNQSRSISEADAKLIAVYRVRGDVGRIRSDLGRVAKFRDAVGFADLAGQLKGQIFSDIRNAAADFREAGTPVPATLAAAADAIAGQFAAMQRLIEAGDWTAVSLRIDNQMEDILSSVRDMVTQVSVDVNRQRLRSMREIRASQRRARVVLGLTGLASIAIALFLGIRTTRSIVEPLSRLKEAAHQLAEGDFHIAPALETSDELGELSRAFTDAADKLRRYYLALNRSNQDLERFAYIASHDLQEPLRTVSAFSELLRRQCGANISKEGHECISLILEAAARMRQLVTGILEYSRLASSAEPVEQRVEMEEVLRGALQNLHAAIAQSQALVTHEPLPAVIGNALQLSQLLQNLIGNGIKYSREGVVPRIHISAEARGAMRRFCVADNGIGIAPECHERVFGMFKQLNPGAREGVGVGLAVSKRIVERHGGEMSLASEVGQGSRFYFTLRAADTRFEHPRPADGEGAQAEEQVRQLVF